MTNTSNETITIPSADLDRLMKFWRELSKSYREQAERRGEYDYGRGNLKGLAAAYNGAAEDLEDVLKRGWDTA
jgi:hypothetical protein